MTGRGLVTIGQTMGVVRSQTARPLEHGSALTLTMAGAESNVAIGLRRLGVPATWIGHLGADALAAMIRRELTAEGVQVRAAVDPVRPTGLMISERRTADTTRIWYYRTQAAGAGLSIDDVDEELISEASLLHLTGITPCLGPEPAKAVNRAAEIAQAAQVPVSFDLNYRKALADPAQFAAAVKPLIAAADITFATLEEAGVLAGVAGHAEAAQLLHDLGAAAVVVKRGPEGSYLSDADGILHQDAAPARVVDTVGAGDAFEAGFLFAYLAGHDRARRLQAAAEVAGFAVASDGDWEGLPTLAELSLQGGQDVLR
jgi:2-dehydro-3-deoxygluconokinase